MNNLVLEMKNIVEDSNNAGLLPLTIRIKLKEYLQYFILDFIYNSKFKELNFYGGSCLRIIHDLSRMSEDLDFEAEEGFNSDEFVKDLEKYFHSKLLIKNVEIDKKTTKNNVFTSVIKLQVMMEVGLSNNKNDKLKIKVDIRTVFKNYFESMNIIYTPISRYGKTFVVKHYDLPTLMSTKLAALLQRQDRGYLKCDPSGHVNYKGRDFYDMLWFMEKGVLPNEKALKACKVDFSVEELFDEIAIRLSKMNLEGIKADLLNLLENLNYLNNWIENFRDTFSRLQNNKYRAKNGLKLNGIFIMKDFDTNAYKFRFEFKSEFGKFVNFRICLSREFVHDVQVKLNNIDVPDFAVEIIWNNVDEKDKELCMKLVKIFDLKIQDYLNRHNNSVYFEAWESKSIREDDHHFNPSKQIILSLEQLQSENIKLEDLAM